MSFKKWFAATSSFAMADSPPAPPWHTLTDFASSHLSAVTFVGLCILDGGVVGMAPSWCREGDEAFVLQGADCPFLLRRVPWDDGGCYRLGGPACIDRLYHREGGYDVWGREGNRERVEGCCAALK